MLAYKKLAFDFYPSFRDGEFKGVVDLILECYKELGIKNFLNTKQKN